MEFRLDSHTHTLASGHAYCTLLEMVRAAADRGLELICITDHAPGMELTTHEDYFLNFRVIDRELYGVRVMMGAELNVMDFDGTVDLSQAAEQSGHGHRQPAYLVHAPGRRTGGEYGSHGPRHGQLPQNLYPGTPGRRPLPLDYPALVRAAGERGVLLEVNNTSLSPPVPGKTPPPT